MSGELSLFRPVAELVARYIKGKKSSESTNVSDTPNGGKEHDHITSFLNPVRNKGGENRDQKGEKVWWRGKPLSIYAAVAHAP